MRRSKDLKFIQPSAIPKIINKNNQRHFVESEHLLQRPAEVEEVSSSRLRF